MWVEKWLTRTALRLGAQAAGERLREFAARVRNQGGVPLVLALPDGGRLEFSDAPRVTLRVRDRDTLAELTTANLATLADAFVEGRLDVDGDTLEAVAAAERLAAAAGAPVDERSPVRDSRHTREEDRAAIAFHYDVGNDFYRLWLDERMVYSCAYFREAGATLEAAQTAKLDLICRKLRLGQGERLLDIGCGWGGLVIHAASAFGARAVGITLSASQHELASERIKAAGLSDRCEVLLLDYRDAPARFGRASFDKVASVGMFEHVGRRRLPEYFGAVRDMLRERGLFMNHGITAADVDQRPVGSGVGDFISRHVFPHGELPHLHVAVREMAAQGFEVADVESLRPHYALTLAHWSRRLDAQLDSARALVGERKLRTWRAYLAGCSHGFARGWMNVYQVLASKQTEPGPTGLPLTREKAV